MGTNRLIIAGMTPNHHSPQSLKHCIPAGELFTASQRPFDIKHGDDSLPLLRRWIRGLYISFANGLHNQS